jgi:hypothetical protein
MLPHLFVKKRRYWADTVCRWLRVPVGVSLAVKTLKFFWRDRDSREEKRAPAEEKRAVDIESYPCTIDDGLRVFINFVYTDFFGKLRWLRLLVCALWTWLCLNDRKLIACFRSEEKRDAAEKRAVDIESYPCTVYSILLNPFYTDFFGKLRWLWLPVCATSLYLRMPPTKGFW